MEEVDIEQESGVCTIWLNRPVVRNALSRSLRKEIVSAVREAEADDGVSCVVIRGRGRSFCSGQDLHETRDMASVEADGWIADFDELFSAVRLLNKPSLAAIEGYAAGAGLQLALVCDVRIATETARFGMPELNVGIPCVTGTGLLLPIVGQGRTNAIVFGGGFISGVLAESWGLVSAAVSEAGFEEALAKWSSHMAKLPATAVRLTKGWIRELTQEIYDLTIRKGAELHTDAFSTTEPRENMGRFLDERRGD